MRATNAGAGNDDAGEVLATQIIRLMRETQIPNGLADIGYSAEDIPALTDGSFPQRRLLANAPREISRDELSGLYRSAMHYW